MNHLSKYYHIRQTFHIFSLQTQLLVKEKYHYYNAVEELSYNRMFKEISHLNTFMEYASIKIAGVEA